jgi:predicted RNase H-like HicB family nuclease
LRSRLGAFPDSMIDLKIQMTKHEIILYWSDEDQSFIAEVPELEALANVEVVIDEWIETAKELGRPIPEPKGRLLFA